MCIICLYLCMLTCKYYIILNYTFCICKNISLYFQWVQLYVSNYNICIYMEYNIFIRAFIIIYIYDIFKYIYIYM